MHLTRQFETAVCGGSNLKAPMKLDFLRSLCAQERHAWPEVVLCRVEGEPLPVCCLSEAAAGDLFSRVGIVSAPSEALTALLRTAPVRARITALCDSAGEPCDGDAPEVWGFLAEYRCGDALSAAVRAAIDGAAARGCASAEALTARAEYLLEQAVPEGIILRVFAGMFSLPEYPEMVPDPPVRYVQADSFGALTRALAYRLSGLHLRLVGSKGCGKNTLIQTVDWLLNVPQYRMQGNAELDKLDLLGGPTIENGTMRYRLSDMLRYLAAGADVVLDEGNTIKPECADVLHSLTDAARQIQVPGYGLVQMHPHSAFTITMNEDYAGTNFMNEATIDRFTPIHIAEPESIVDVLHRVVPEASAASLNICDYVYCAIRDRIRSAGGLEPDAMTIRGFIDALRAEPLLGLRWGLLDNVASKPQDAYTRLQLTELIESMVPQDGRI